MEYSKQSVIEYYNKVIRNKHENAEHLFDEVNIDFVEIIGSMDLQTPKKALDLGYGYGNYTYYMLTNNIDVVAVDLIDSDILKERIGKQSVERDVLIIKEDVTQYSFDDMFDLIISKDVLHFLNKQQIESLLKKAEQSTNSEGWNYFVIFTEIVRKDSSGSIIKIDGEASLLTNEVVEMVNSIYKKWDVKVLVENYRELDKRAGLNEYYFKAERIVVICKKSICGLGRCKS